MVWIMSGDYVNNGARSGAAAADSLTGQRKTWPAYCRSGVLFILSAFFAFVCDLNIQTWIWDLVSTLA